MWEDDQESFLEEVVRLERKLRGGKEEEHGSLRLPLKCFPEREWEGRSGR